METNPFDDEHGIFFVVVNHQLQHSLWPAHLDVPTGWRVALTASTRADCIAYVEQHWLDIRPVNVSSGTTA